MAKTNVKVSSVTWYNVKKEVISAKEDISAIKDEIIIIQDNTPTDGCCKNYKQFLFGFEPQMSAASTVVPVVDEFGDIVISPIPEGMTPIYTLKFPSVSQQSYNVIGTVISHETNSSDLTTMVATGQFNLGGEFIVTVKFLDTSNNVVEAPQGLVDIKLYNV